MYIPSYIEYLIEAQSSESGSARATRGFDFERILNKVYPWDSTKSYERPASPYDKICNDMDAILLQKNPGKEIVAIGKGTILKTPAGGAPKADIIFQYMLRDASGRRSRITTDTCAFSLKTTNAKRVSVHQGTIEQFFNGIHLSPANANYDILKKGLEQFNADGSWKAHKTWPKEEQEKFKMALKGIMGDIAKYVMSTGNGGTPADAVIVYDPAQKKYTVAGDAEYIKMCEESLKKCDGFGGLFSYTYPHKKKGQQIQLKIPVVLKKSL